MSWRPMPRRTTATPPFHSFDCTTMKNILLTATLLLAATSSYATIQFAPGWDDPGNSNAGVFTRDTATTALSHYSDDLKAMIQSSKCVLQVIKSCHQPNDPHFTVTDATPKGCKLDNIYSGTRSVHIPC